MGSMTIYVNAGGKPALVNLWQDPDTGYVEINSQRLATSAEVTAYSADVAPPVPINP